MDGGAGLVAVIFTFHEPSLWAGIIVALIAIVIYALVFRRLGTARMLLGAGVLFFSTVFLVVLLFGLFGDVTTFDVEAVRATAPPY